MRTLLAIIILILSVEFSVYVGVLVVLHLIGGRQKSQIGRQP